jgi:hypothetical protein
MRRWTTGAYLSIARCEEASRTRELIRLAQFLSGELPFVYSSDESALTIETARGAAD